MPARARFDSLDRLMKQLALVLLLAVSLFAAGDPAKEKELRAAMESWRQATLQADRASLEKLLGDDLMYSHSTGLRESKADFVAAIMANKPKYESIEFGEMNVHFYGDTAVVQSPMTLRSKQPNADTTTSRLDVLQVWTKSKGGWRLAARHAAKMP